MRKPSFQISHYIDSKKSSADEASEDCADYIAEKTISLGDSTSSATDDKQSSSDSDDSE